MPNKRNLKDYGFLVLKGMGMGAADVVPGVSGGTIAFIVGIYEELIDSIKSINGTTLKQLFTGKIAAFWKGINANFLLFYRGWYRYQHILAGEDHYVSLGVSPDLGMVFFLWLGAGLYLVLSLRISSNGTGRRS